MAEVLPFKGFRYNIDRVHNLSSVITPPYDVISNDARERYYEAHPNNIIRIELGKEEPGDNPGNNKYTRARGYLWNWIKEGILLQDRRPCIYIHEMSYVHQAQLKSVLGFICAVRLEELTKGVILAHEETMPKPKQDRLELMRACRANTSPILGLYSDPKGVLMGVLKEATSGSPSMEVVDSYGVLHRIWTIEAGFSGDEFLVARIIREMADKVIVIADGHHRYETALLFREEAHSICQNSNYQKPGRRDLASGPYDYAMAPALYNYARPYDYVMMTLVGVENEGLAILPTHRLVRNVDTNVIGEFLANLTTAFEVETIIPDSIISEAGSFEGISRTFLGELAKRGLDRHVFGMYLRDMVNGHKIDHKVDHKIDHKTGIPGGLSILTLRDEKSLDETIPQPHSPRWKHLDVAILHELLLGRFLGVNIPGTGFGPGRDTSSVDANSTSVDANSTGIGVERRKTDVDVVYTRDEIEVFRRVRNGEFQIGFFLNPPKVRDVIEIAMGGEKMPQKSTYFYPKLPTGLIIRVFD